MIKVKKLKYGNFADKAFFHEVCVANFIQIIKQAGVIINIMGGVLNWFGRQNNPPPPSPPPPQSLQSKNCYLPPRVAESTFKNPIRNEGFPSYNQMPRQNRPIHSRDETQFQKYPEQRFQAQGWVQNERPVARYHGQGNAQNFQIIREKRVPIQSQNNVRLLYRQTIPSRNSAASNKVRFQENQTKLRKNFDPYETEDSNQIISLHELVVNSNKFEEQFLGPEKHIKIRDTFKSELQYIQNLSQLLKYEVILNINQAIDKMYDLKAELQGGIAGFCQKIFKIVKNQRIQIWTFRVETEEDNVRFAKILLKGEKACIASPNQKLNSEEGSESGKGICQIFIVKYKQKQKYFQLHFKEDSKLIKYDKKIYLFDLDPIITYIRAMNAINFIKNSEHSMQILNPKQTTQEQSNDIRRKFLEGSLMKSIQQKRNPAQARTIKEILLNRTGIHLVQGPPGTGKTSTILNFMAAQLRCLSSQKHKQVIMICSESNAAIDDIGHKIKEEGLIDCQVNQNQIVRLGQVTLASENLIQYNLKHRCEQRMFGGKTSVELEIQIEKLEQAMKTKSFQTSRQMKKTIRKLEENILQINESIEKNRGQFNQIQSQVLSNAKVLLSTLSSSGRAQIVKFYENEIGCLVIDEACQTTQPTILIPFSYQPRKVVLVGDPKQLEPTVISRKQHTKYSRSLFERFIDCGRNPAFLDIQYRMIPEISQFSNQHIYEGRLINGRTSGKPPSFKGLNKKFQRNSLLFIDVAYGKEQSKSKSYFNMEQASIIAFITRKFAQLDSNLTIGVISPYSSQTKTVDTKIMEEIPNQQRRKNIKISTVDAFQGQQKDVILITCVRANAKGELGFVSNERRLNVALTRAKNALIVVGNGKTLNQGGIWNQFIKFAKLRNSFLKIESLQSGKDKIRSLFYRQPQRINVEEKIIDELFL